MSWEERFYAAYRALVAIERRLEAAEVKPRRQPPLAHPLEELSWEQRFQVAFYAVLALEAEEERANAPKEPSQTAALFLEIGQPKWYAAALHHTTKPGSFVRKRPSSRKPRIQPG
jgi:hypothetical protein